MHQKLGKRYEKYEATVVGELRTLIIEAVRTMA